MVNFDSVLYTEGEAMGIAHNRAFKYGDGIFETMKVANGQVLFAEDHYFRLMAGMRILRMEIPMNFTQEYLQDQVAMVIHGLGVLHARVRLAVFRKEDGYYLPATNDVSFAITAEPLDTPYYTFSESPYEVDIYKDFHVGKHLLSTVKTANRLINITGSIYARENGLDDCLLINEEKQVIGGLQGNIFLVTGGVIKTPPLSDGCIKGVMRKQLIAHCRKLDGYEFREESVSPFELQKADEIFLSNVIRGVRPVTKYRKKEFENGVTQRLWSMLNASIEG